jgi:hypothetical protein
MFKVLNLMLLLALSCMSTSAFTVRTSAKITNSPALNSMTSMISQKQIYRKTSSLHMADETPAAKESSLPMLLDPGTKGGALFLSLVLFILPIGGYEVATLGFGVDGIEAGKWIGVGFTFFTTVLWVGTYIFRVATKDMTYVSNSSLVV